MHQTRLRGAPVELGRVLVADNAAESPWNTVAYEVALKGRGDVKLTRADFEAAVKNFRRYPRVPVVLQHADTDPGGHPDAAKARGWITDLRVGQMDRGGKPAATLEAKFTLDEATRADVNRDPPAWAYCSVTMLLNARDEESNARLGAVLYSLSLTNNPALQGLDRIAATDERGAAAKEHPMSFLALAAKLNLAAASDEEAESKIMALAAQLADVRRALKLGAGATAAELLDRVTTALADAASVATLAKDLEAAKTELEALRTAAKERASAERAAYLDALVAHRPELADVRDALELQAAQDWDGFQKRRPLPSAAEQRERAKDAARFERITASTSAAGAIAPTPAPAKGATVAAIDARVRRVMAETGCTYSQALGRLGGK